MIITNRFNVAKPELIIFDLFGTLIQFGVMRHPFRQLLKWASANGRQPRADDARRLMTVRADVLELAAALGIYAPEILIEQIKEDIQEELNSLSLFPDVTTTLTRLTERGIPFAICSNLAAPYGEALDRLLGDFQFLRCLSYEIGFIKPENGIYQFLIAQSNVPPQNCFFVGDTYAVDYQGPLAFGMNAMHLVRGEPDATGFTINSLTEILKYFQS